MRLSALRDKASGTLESGRWALHWFPRSTPRGHCIVLLSQHLWFICFNDELLCNYAPEGQVMGMVTLFSLKCHCCLSLSENGSRANCWNWQGDYVVVCTYYSTDSRANLILPDNIYMSKRNIHKALSELWTQDLTVIEY